MRVLLDARTATDHFPGIGRYVVNLARALARVAPDLDLSLLHDPHAPAARLVLPDRPRIPCAVSPFSPRQQWVVPSVIRQAGADIYHSAYYLMPYRPGRPSALTCHDLIPLVYPEYYTRWQPLIFRLATTLALRSAAVVLAISQATKADLVRYFHTDPARIRVTPLAADDRIRPAGPESIAAVRRKYNLPDQYLLYLGINKPHKNLVRLVEAWGRWLSPAYAGRSPHPVRSNTRLVIAGAWDARYPGAMQRAEQLGLTDAVCFAGTVTDADLPALYSGANAFVFPSLYEGFGLPVLEAMACGTPVICSRTSSLPEVAGDAAVRVDPTSVEALAEAIGSVLTDEVRRQDLRTRGLAQAGHFSWEETARQTLEAYRAISPSA